MYYPSKWYYQYKIKHKKLTLHNAHFEILIARTMLRQLFGNFQITLTAFLMPHLVDVQIIDFDLLDNQ